MCTYASLRRFPLSESIHEMIVAILLKSMTHDAVNRDRQGHLQTLLNLDIPHLFNIYASDVVQKCQQTFVDGWKTFIEDKQMLDPSQKCLSEFLVSVPN